MKIIEDILFTNEKKKFNVLEFGPFLDEKRVNLVKASFSNKHNYYCIDLIDYDIKNICDETHNKDVYNYVNKYNINYELKNYNEVCMNPTETLINQFKTFKPNFYDIIFCKYSMKHCHIEGMTKLADILGKKDCKTIFIPHLNDSDKSSKDYENIINNLNLPKGWTIGDLGYKGNKNIGTGLRKKNIAVTKNININKLTKNILKVT